MPVRSKQNALCSDFHLKLDLVRSPFGDERSDRQKLHADRIWIGK
jgi:hypothetical protein